MSKWYEVTVEAWEVVVVEVKDGDGEDQAADIALDEGNFTFISDKEVAKVELLDTPERIERAKRHANEVSPLPAE